VLDVFVVFDEFKRQPPAMSDPCCALDRPGESWAVVGFAPFTPANAYACRHQWQFTGVLEGFLRLKLSSTTAKT
jgi:hypothetical protein